MDGKVRTFVSPAQTTIRLRQLQSLNISIAGFACKAGPTGFAMARTLQAVGIEIVAISSIFRLNSANSINTNGHKD